MGVEEFNRQVVEALEKAQKVTGHRSGASFARRLATHTGGSPDTTTYNRWLRGDATVPAWALLLAAKEAGVAVDALLPSDDHEEAGTSAWKAGVVDAIGRLEAELIEVRQHLGLQWHSSHGQTGAPQHGDDTAETDVPAAGPGGS